LFDLRSKCVPSVLFLIICIRLSVSHSGVGPVEENESISLEGSGTVAQDQGVGADVARVAIGRDVHDRVIVVGKGDPVTVTVRGENLRGKELAYLDGLLRRYEYWRGHYTPLAGMAEVRAAAPDGSRLDLSMPFIPPGFEKLVEYGYGERAVIRRVPVDDLRKAITEHQRIILLGEPGSGKTTTLWRLAYDLAIAARGDGRAPLPVLVALGGYTDAGSFDDYLARHLRPLAPYLESYRASGRLILLLDGLNEMPRAGYAERVGRIQHALDRHLGETVVVTCRATDYSVNLEGLRQVEVAPLDEARIRAFLHNYLGRMAGERLFWTLAGGGEVHAMWEVWREEVGDWGKFWTAEGLPPNAHKRNTLARDRLARFLVRRQQQPPPLLTLGRNPYMLLMTAQVYASTGGELPANRARLIAAFVDTLLKRAQKRGIAEWETDPLWVKNYLGVLAHTMWADPEQGAAVERDWAVERLRHAVPGCDADRLLFLATNTSLLVADGMMVRFYHQLLQSYFAACELGWRLAVGENLAHYWPEEHWWQPSGWEETFTLLAGMMPDASALLEELAAANPIVAASCIVEGGAQADDGARLDVTQSLITRTTDERQPPKVRVQAGDALAKLGDPRFRADAWYLSDEPLLGFVEIPAGPFRMGSDPEQDPNALDYELPQHSVDLPTYHIARLPLTVAQFRAFVRESGYETQEQWEVYNSLDNHPVVRVTWRDAQAYCIWLTEQLRAWEGMPESLARLLREEEWRVRLPTEAEWEKAARGVDGRIFPWGNELDLTRANYAGTDLGTTSPVGCFPGGSSPYGCLDMAGNVREWTHSLWQTEWRSPGLKYPYDPQDGREDPKSGGQRVLRGGGFLDIQSSLRCAFRSGNLPGLSFLSRGFRIVVAPGP
jgi:formylglycine-generating enzyme required for sulfatase activity